MPTSNERKMVSSNEALKELICAETIDAEAYRRHPERYLRICNIDVASCTDKKSIIQNTLLAACSKRGDALAIKVKARINFSGDLRAVEAKYHHSCMQTFLSKKNFSQTKVSNTRNLNQANNKAFTTLCEWLNASEQEDHMFTFGELRVHLSTYLPLIRRGLITWGRNRGPARCVLYPEQHIKGLT